MAVSFAPDETGEHTAFEAMAVDRAGAAFTPWRLLARSLIADVARATRELRREATIASVKSPQGIPPRFRDPHLRDIEVLAPARPSHT